MRALCQKIADNEQFQSFILFLILLNAFFLGLETVPELSENYGPWFFLVFYTSQVIFVFEILIRMRAEPSIKEFFNDFWNCFDFVVVALSLFPEIGSWTLAARVLRVLRLLRVVSTSDRLRGFADRLHDAADEVVYTGLIVFVLGYVFSLSGHYLFSDLAPEH
jgi:voltage-gated sodium channel